MAPLSWGAFFMPWKGFSMFVRVKDSTSGHEFDVHETDWRIEAGHLVPVKSDRFPPSPVARLPKFNVGPVKATPSKKEP